MTMKNCPTCGAELSAALVDQIIDPSQDASCPRSAPKAKTSAPIINISDSIPLSTLMMIAANVRGELRGV